ncbi:MAG TPA: type 1 glutamine amidotransferase domain-containing protein [Gemmatimonadaceae bacterium]|jgi:protease I|nr:type 1 glutamine amidotransferase domain-containing protein [Gemmatimonadaceae bacterium]
MAGNLLGRKVAVLATDGVEQVELTAPWQALKEAQAEVTLVSLKPGDIQGFIHQEKADTFHVDKIAKDVTARDFDALVIPGGVRNTEALRASPEVIQLVRGFMEADKPVAAICHAPRLLVAADAVQGRTLTSHPELADEIKSAGASWVDKQASVDQRLLTSRRQEDLPAFCGNLIAMLTSAIDERRLDKMVEQTFPASDPLPGPVSL